MRVSIEYLYHFRCDRDPNHWWTIADRKVEIGDGAKVFCPHCGHENVVEGFDSYLVESTAPSRHDQDAATD